MARRTSPNDIILYGPRRKHIRRGYSRLLRMADKDGVKFTLNSGYRSIRQQWVLWWRYKRGKGPLAAFPGSSTHNRRNWKQGLDIDATNGGAERFRRWALRRGIVFKYTVAGEPWHLNAVKNYDRKILQMARRRGMV